MMPRDLIVFGEDWGGLPSSSQHLIKHLSKDRKVLWVNSIGLRRPGFNRRDIRRVGKKICRYFLSQSKRGASCSKLGTAETEIKKTEYNNVCVVNPLSVPVPNNAFERSLSVKLLTRQLRPKIESLNLHDPILWISLPTAVDIVGHLGESGVVYYCGDDFSSLSGVDNVAVTKSEQRLLDNSDLVVTASRALAERFDAHRPLFLPHGVDYDLFSSPAKKAADYPDNDQPTAGFYGSLSEWFDLDLMFDVASALPDWNFVFIGKKEVDLSRLETLDNTYFLGEKSHVDLPSYSRHWQVSMLPFKNNGQIRSCNPLKLMEYLAVGKPIVSTDFPAIHPYREMLHTARTADAFVEAIGLSRYSYSLPLYPLALKERVKKETWEEKAAILSERLECL